MFPGSVRVTADVRDHCCGRCGDDEVEGGGTSEISPMPPEDVVLGGIDLLVRIADANLLALY
jgi:hypothetical protein